MDSSAVISFSRVKSLQAHKVGLLGRIIPAEGFAIKRDCGKVGARIRRHNLRDDRALRIPSGLSYKFLCSNKRDSQKDGMPSGRVGFLDDLRYGRVRANDQYSSGIHGPYGVQALLHVERVARESAHAHRRGIMLLQGKLQAAEHRLAKSVILVDHTALVDAQNIPKIFYLLPRLIVVRSADVEHVML